MVDLLGQSSSKPPAIPSPIPATPLQTGMLFHSLANPRSGVDIEQISVLCHEPLDLDRLTTAIGEVFGRHPILNSHFSWHQADGPPTLHFDAPRPIELTLEDWSDLPREAIDDRIAATLAEDRLLDFDLGTGPLYRFRLAQFSPRGWWLLWSFHHTILDGRSFPIVLTEIFNRYDGIEDRTGPPAAEFRDYVEVIGSQDSAAGAAYWSTRLAGLQATSSIPASEPAPAALDRDQGDAVTAANSYEELTLGVDRTDRLRQLAEKAGVTLNTCLQAAWHLLLHHHSQSQVVSFGTTRACRHTTVGAEDMVGLLINTVPMVLEADREESVASLLTRVRSEQRNLRAVETMPLTAIAEHAPVASGDLFSSIVVFDDASLDERMRAAFPTETGRRFRYDGQTNYPLTLLAYADPSMSLRLEFAVDRHDRADAARLLGQLVNLLDGFVADQTQTAVGVPYLTAAEVAEQDRWNNTVVPYDLSPTLMELFEQQVERTPTAVALEFGDRSLSYEEFNRRANQLANHLRNRGVGPEVTVGIFAERSFELMIGVYAILKAGGAYVPLDPDHPTERLQFMSEDSGVRQVLTQRHLTELLPDSSLERIVLDGADVPWAALPTDNPPATAGPDNLAYLLYTSGSTGRPKGAMIEHRSIVNRLRWMQDAFPLNGSDGVLQKTPYTFDVSIWELFWPLQVGARLAIAQPGGHRDPAQLVREIETHRVTTLHFVPSMLQLFVQEPTIDRCTSIRRIICSGEALPRSLQDRLLETLDTELHNLYGPTEAAIDVSWWACDPKSELETVPIGHPIANTTLHVLDPGMQRLPVGVPGELHIGGVQVGRGYHNRPVLTAETFVNDPFDSDPKARLYKTGDLVRYHRSGAIEFLGRIDHQIKIHGQRVELGEIENTITGHPGVTETVVVATGGPQGPAELVAYVVSDNTEPDLEQSLDGHCRRLLPTYMVPGLWVFLDALPLSTNGKVDRSALPRPAMTGRRHGGTPNATETEEAVAAVWRSLLEDRPFGATDPFFSVGGNSLLLIRLAHLLTERFGVQVEVARLLTSSTVRQQANLVTGSEDSVDLAVEAGARQAGERKKRRARGRARRPGGTAS